MSYILNIETATTVCSVAIAEKGNVLFFKEINEGFTHAENLHLFVEEALKALGITAKQLSAIAVSKGPGSYTGLRIGVSAAKGLSYALGIPLISVDTLQIMANAAVLKKREKAAYCPMIDARRMEIYTSVFDLELNSIMETEALIVDETNIQKFKDHTKVYYFGDGMPKCRTLLEQLKNSDFIEGIHPSAEYMTSLSYNKFLNKELEDLAYFEPFYLKDFMILSKKTKI